MNDYGAYIHGDNEEYGWEPLCTHATREDAVACGFDTHDAAPAVYTGVKTPVPVAVPNASWFMENVDEATFSDWSDPQDRAWNTCTAEELGDLQKRLREAVNSWLASHPRLDPAATGWYLAQNIVEHVREAPE